MDMQQLIELGFIIDRACDIGDEAELKLIIAYLSTQLKYPFPSYPQSVL